MTSPRFRPEYITVYNDFKEALDQATSNYDRISSSYDLSNTARVLPLMAYYHLTLQAIYNDIAKNMNEYSYASKANKGTPFLQLSLKISDMIKKYNLNFDMRSDLYFDYIRYGINELKDKKPSEMSVKEKITLQHICRTYISTSGSRKQNTSTRADLARTVAGITQKYNPFDDEAYSGGPAAVHKSILTKGAQGSLASSYVASNGHSAYNSNIIHPEDFYMNHPELGALSYDDYLQAMSNGQIEVYEPQIDTSGDESWLGYLSDKVWFVAVPAGAVSGETATTGGVGAFVARTAPMVRNFVMRASPYALAAGVVLYMVNEAFSASHYPGHERIDFAESNDYIDQQILGYSLNGEYYSTGTDPLMSELGYQKHNFDLNSAMGYGYQNPMQDMVIVTYDKSDYTKADIRDIYKNLGISLDG